MDVINFTELLIIFRTYKTILDLDFGETSLFLLLSIFIKVTVIIIRIKQARRRVGVQTLPDATRPWQCQLSSCRNPKRGGL